MDDYEFNSRIKSDEDMMRVCCAAMMACEQYPLMKDGLLALYEAVTPIEEKGDNEITLNLLRIQIKDAFEHVIENDIPTESPEGFDLEEMSKCFAAVLWCHRAVDYVDMVERQLVSMANLQELFSSMRDAAFQHDNS